MAADKEMCGENGATEELTVMELTAMETTKDKAQKKNVQ